MHTLSENITSEGRDSSFSVLKAVAIISVVIAHSGAPSWLGNCVYIYCVAIFFICSGYFFKLSSLKTMPDFLFRRCYKIYRPFWIWSVCFLILHNLFFKIGLFSEEYGNAMGGVQHPYSWHDFMQHFWSITFNMSGYDQFVGGAFWFFRTLFISSIVFYFLFLLIPRLSCVKRPKLVGLTIMILCTLLVVWKVTGNLKITGLSQGGYRELVALIFMSIGFLYRRFQYRMRHDWLWAIGGLVLLIVFSVFSPSSMGYTATLAQFVSLVVPAFGAFLFFRKLSQCIDVRDGLVSRGLVYIGDHSLYIFAFHLLAFKLVSLVKVCVYDLPWSHLGGHPFVHDYSDTDCFWLLYTVVGVALPLLLWELWKSCDRKYDLTWKNCLIYLYHGILALLKLIGKILVAIFHYICDFIRRVVNDFKEFIRASNPNDE